MRSECPVIAAISGTQQPASARNTTAVRRRSRNWRSHGQPGLVGDLSEQVREVIFGVGPAGGLAHNDGGGGAGYRIERLPQVGNRRHSNQLARLALTQADRRAVVLGPAEAQHVALPLTQPGAEQDGQPD